MQYYIQSDKLMELLASQSRTMDNLLRHLSGNPAANRRLLTEGGPTRNLHLINQIDGYLECFLEAYAKVLQAEGDNDIPPKDHTDDPLCYDIHQFRD